MEVGNSRWTSRHPELGRSSQWKVVPTSTLESGIMLGPIQNEMLHGIVKSFFFRFALGSCPEESDNGLSLHKPAIINNPLGDAHANLLRPLSNPCLETEESAHGLGSYQSCRSS